MEKPEEYLSTKEFAISLMVQPNTVHRGVCVNGDYMGIKPAKMPNGRLIWKKSDRDRLLKEIEKH